MSLVFITSEAGFTLIEDVLVVIIRLVLPSKWPYLFGLSLFMKCRCTHPLFLLFCKLVRFLPSSSSSSGSRVVLVIESLFFSHARHL